MTLASVGASRYFVRANPCRSDATMEAGWRRIGTPFRVAPAPSSAWCITLSNGCQIQAARVSFPLTSATITAIARTPRRNWRCRRGGPQARAVRCDVASRKSGDIEELFLFDDYRLGDDVLQSRLQVALGVLVSHRNQLTRRLESNIGFSERLESRFDGVRGHFSNHLTDLVHQVVARGRHGGDDVDRISGCFNRSVRTLPVFPTTRRLDPIWMTPSSGLQFPVRQTIGGDNSHRCSCRGLRWVVGHVLQSPSGRFWQQPSDNEPEHR
jgi:hypothetical protein